MLTNEYLNDFFENEVKLNRKKTSEAKRTVMSKVNQLLQFINKEDLRFGDRAMKVGSSFQGLKTKTADEFDFNIVLIGLGQFHNVPLKKRYYGFSESVDEDALKTTPTDIDVVSKRLPLPDPPEGYAIVSFDNDSDDVTPIWQNSSDLIFDGDIIPYLVRKRLKELLLKAIRDLDLRGELRLGRKVHGPALTVRIPYEDDGIEEITIDFAPTIPNLGTLEEEAVWPPRNIRWPSREKVQQLNSIQLRGIAKKPFDWLTSYSKCEEVLMEDIDSDGGCRRKSLRILKHFREMYWCKTTKPVISSYHLKNILFLECERYPSSQDWEQGMLNIRVRSMTERILAGANRERLPQYFNRSVNLIEVQGDSDRETLGLEKRTIKEFLEEKQKQVVEE